MSPTWSRSVGSVAVPCTHPVLSPPQNMSLSSAMVLPLLIVVAAGVYYIYNEVMQFMSKSLVRNKVVVITDAVSGVGTGKWSNLCFKCCTWLSLSWRFVFTFLCFFACLYVCPPVYLPSCWLAYLPVCLFVCLSGCWWLASNGDSLSVHSGALSSVFIATVSHFSRQTYLLTCRESEEQISTTSHNVPLK